MSLEPLAAGDPGRVGPHRVLARLGRGGMGTVYLAVTPDDRVVAVKVLRDGPADAEGRRRFQRELDVLRRVRGPHLVEVLDGDATAATPWIVTRFVPGRRLDEVVGDEGPLPGPALRRVALGIARGLQALHAAGVVHRDLTPGNVLIEDGEPHVIDLGLAVVADVTSLTRSGLVVGTAGYLAPEQVLGEGCSAAVDVHAWGATLALAGTGRPPYGVGRPDAVLYRVVHHEPDLAGLDPVLAPLVARAMDKDPARRPEVAELVTALEGAGRPARDLVGASTGPHARAAVGPGVPSLEDVTTVLGRDLTALLARQGGLPPDLPVPDVGGPARPDGPTTVLRLPVEEPPPDTTVLRRPVQDPTTVLRRPVEDPTTVLRRPVEDPTTVLRRPVQDPTTVLRRPGQDPDPVRRPGDDGGAAPDLGPVDATPPLRPPSDQRWSLLVLAVTGLALLGGLALVLPVATALADVAALVALQAGTRAGLRSRQREQLRGPRRRDGLLTVLDLPLQVVGAGVDLLRGLPLLVVGAAVPAAAAVALVGRPDRAAAGVAVACVLGTVLTLTGAVWSRARAHLDRTARRRLPGGGGAALLGAVLLVAAVLLAGAGLSSGASWWPARGQACSVVSCR